MAELSAVFSVTGISTPDMIGHDIILPMKIPLDVVATIVDSLHITCPSDLHGATLGLRIPF